MFSIGKKVKEL